MKKNFLLELLMVLLATVALTGGAAYGLYLATPLVMDFYDYDVTCEYDKTSAGTLTRNIRRKDFNEDYIAYQKPHGLTMNVPDSPNSFRQIVNDNFGSDLYYANRLDKGTAGVLVLSKNKEAVSYLSKKIHDREVDKFYVALLLGEVPEYAVYEDFLDTSQRKTKVVDESDPDAKHAKLEIWPLEYGQYLDEPVTLARIKIHTGRTHQIRIQAGSRGFPVIGDDTYGDRDFNSKFREESRFEWFLLWANEYSFDGNTFSFDYEPCWERVLEDVDWKSA